jgi:CubicO group peptidase (beta-lactamase class C family)
MNFISRIAIALLCYATSTPPAFAQTIPLPPAAQAYLQSELEAQKIPGVAVVVIKDGKILHQSAIGFADVENRVPVTTKSIFHSGSTGKMFTAVSLLLLAEEGKLDLDAPITRYLPELPPRFEKVTARNLLTMSGGIPDFQEDMAPAEAKSGRAAINLWQDYDSTALLGLIAKGEFAFEPGTDHRYSNGGYVLAGLLAEKIAGCPYYELLQEQVFSITGMNSASEARWFEIVPNRASSYHWDDGKLRNQDWTAPTLLKTADGGLFFSIEDVGKWLVALDTNAAPLAGITQTLFEPAKLNDGSRPYNLYSMGWQKSDVNGHAAIFHGGTWDGFRAFMIRYPERKISVAVLANLNSAKVGEMGRSLAAMIDPALRNPKPVPDNATRWTNEDLLTLKALAKHGLANGRTAASLSRQWTDKQLGQLFDDFTVDPQEAKLEPTLDCAGSKCPRRSYRIAMGRYNMHWSLERDRNGRIARMAFTME